MISKTKINKRIQKKKKPELVETIQMLKNFNLLEIAKKLSVPSKKLKSVNISEINKIEGDVLIVGKVLGSGNLEKRKKIVAFGFTKQAKNKLKKMGCETKKIIEELKSNKSLEGFTII